MGLLPVHYFCGDEKQIAAATNVNVNNWYHNNIPRFAMEHYAPSALTGAIQLSPSQTGGDGLCRRGRSALTI
jgi:hypothetical protein